MFSARDSGSFIGETDGSSLEFRGAGHLGHDTAIRESILRAEDPHLFSASIIFKRPQSEVQSDLRTAAKPYTFKPLYGGKSGTPDEVRYYKAFQAKYKELYDTQTGWTYEVLRSGKLVTPWGLVFYWPGTKMSRSGYIDNTTSIFNYPIQSFCTAEIIPISLVFMWQRAKAAGAKMLFVNTVHDSVVCEVPEEERELFHQLSKQAFMDDVYGYLINNYNINMTVPLGCEVKLGTHWGSGKGQKYESQIPTVH